MFVARGTEILKSEERIPYRAYLFAVGLLSDLKRKGFHSEKVLIKEGAGTFQDVSTSSYMCFTLMHVIPFDMQLLIGGLPQMFQDRTRNSHPGQFVDNDVVQAIGDKGKGI